MNIVTNMTSKWGGVKKVGAAAAGENRTSFPPFQASSALVLLLYGERDRPSGQYGPGSGR